MTTNAPYHPRAGHAPSTNWSTFSVESAEYNITIINLYINLISITIIHLSLYCSKLYFPYLCILLMCYKVNLYIVDSEWVYVYSLHTCCKIGLCNWRLMCWLWTCCFYYNILWTCFYSCNDLSIVGVYGDPSDKGSHVHRLPYEFMYVLAAVPLPLAKLMHNDYGVIQTLRRVTLNHFIYCTKTVLYRWCKRFTSMLQCNWYNLNIVIC